MTCTPFTRDCEECARQFESCSPPQASTAGSALPLAHSPAAPHHADDSPRPAVDASVPYDPIRSVESWIEIVDELEDRVAHFTGTSHDYDVLVADLWARVRESVELMEVVHFLVTVDGKQIYGRLCAYSQLFGHTNADPDAPGATKVMFPALKTHRAIALKFLPTCAT